MRRLALKQAEVRRWREAGGTPGLIFLGDSITQNWELAGPPAWADYAPAWNRLYAPYGAINLGYAGDATENLLWRLQAGEVDGLSPRVAVLLIGINDIILHGRAAPLVLDGIDAILRELSGRLPRTRVLLLGLLPSRVLRRVSREATSVNAALAGRNWNATSVVYLDAQNALLCCGRIDATLYCDRLATPPTPLLLHPSAAGQARLAAAMQPTLTGLLA